MNRYFWFTFTDGYRVCSKGFSSKGLSIEESKHGKLVERRLAV